MSPRPARATKRQATAGPEHEGWHLGRWIQTTRLTASSFNILDDRVEPRSTGLYRRSYDKTLGGETVSDAIADAIEAVLLNDIVETIAVPEEARSVRGELALS